KPELIENIRDNLDVQGFVGHGAHPEALAEAGIAQADMIIAVTLYDEVNMVACQVAHSLFNVPTKIARVRAQSYLKPRWRDLFSSNHMPIDVIISPEVEVGEMVLRRLAVPGAFDTVYFADGQVVSLGVSCNENCPIVDTPLAQLTELFPDLQAVVVGIKRGERLFVPHSTDSMLVGDEVYVICEKNQVARTLGIFGHEEQVANRVVIVGGGNIGLYVARTLESRNSSAKIKIIENSHERAVKIADELRRTVVLHGNSLEREILREAGVPAADTLVALSNDDEVNVITCVMAKRLGCRRNMALINNRSYPDFTDMLGIDATVNPRSVTVSKVLQHVRRGRVRRVHSIDDGMAEVIEAEALETSPLVGKPLKEQDLKDGIRIGAVYRGEKVIVPSGSLQIKAGDRVIIFAVADRVREVEQMFRVSLEFF
ncbi:MAG: Trk system potassium transporter TrkA, partial [Alphaproteobacteria bacterium]